MELGANAGCGVGKGCCAGWGRGGGGVGTLSGLAVVSKQQ